MRRFKSKVSEINAVSKPEIDLSMSRFFRSNIVAILPARYTRGWGGGLVGWWVGGVGGLG